MPMIKKFFVPAVAAVAVAGVVSTTDGHGRGG